MCSVTEQYPPLFLKKKLKKKFWGVVDFDDLLLIYYPRTGLQSVLTHLFSFFSQAISGGHTARVFITSYLGVIYLSLITLFIFRDHL